MQVAASPAGKTNKCRKEVSVNGAGSTTSSRNYEGAWCKAT